MLQDNFGRVHDYLRISLTDRCNFRCLYCLPADEEMHHGSGSKERMTAEEIDRIAGIFVGLGVKKIRLTGGEPLIRKDAAEIIERIAKYPVRMAITTNGTRLHEFVDVFKKTGLKSVNVSLDSLNEKKFLQLTQRNEFVKVKSNIELLLGSGFHVKVNMVVMNGYNHTEVCDFVAWTKNENLHVRFIEFMPFPHNHWQPEKLITHKEILTDITNHFSEIEKLIDDKHDTTKKYRVKNHVGTFAVISTMSEPFCSGCNRLRLTADGKMRNCLFAKTETDLLTPLREGKDIEQLIRENLFKKHYMLGGNEEEQWGLKETVSDNRTMMGIGG
jgi:cyclic pyranopterin phosphate synthase